MSQPTPPDLAKTTQLVLGIVFLSIGAILIAVGGIQLALYLSGSADRLTIEPFALAGGLIFAVPGALKIRRVLMLRRVHLHGLPAEAQILNVEHTKAEVEGSPVVRLHLRVTPPGEAPYDVTIRWLMRPMDGVRLVPGRPVAVKIDPKNRRQVVLA